MRMNTLGVTVLCPIALTLSLGLSGCERPPAQQQKTQLPLSVTYVIDPTSKIAVPSFEPGQVIQWEVPSSAAGFQIQFDESSPCTQTTFVAKDHELATCKIAEPPGRKGKSKRYTYHLQPLEPGERPTTPIPTLEFYVRCSYCQ